MCIDEHVMFAAKLEAPGSGPGLIMETVGGRAQGPHTLLGPHLP